MNGKYSPEMRERALRMLAETLRLWQRRYEVDADEATGVTTEAAAEIKRFQKEVSELRKANEILKAASIFFAKELDYPSTGMIRFITAHRDRFGAELICQVPRPAAQGFLTSRGYRAAVRRTPSARQLRDDLLVPEIARAARGELRRLRAPEDARPDAPQDAISDGTRPNG